MRRVLFVPLVGDDDDDEVVMGAQPVVAMDDVDEETVMVGSGTDFRSSLLEIIYFGYLGYFEYEKVICIYINWYLI